MYKKPILLICLVFVLVPASTANAALFWSVDSITLDIGEQEVVNIISDISNPYVDCLMGNEPSAVAEITSVIPAPGLPPPIEGPPGWWTLVPWSEDVMPPGIYWEVTIAGLAEGSYSINSDYYESTGPNDILSINVIPEPTTIFLLALGGLVVLQKRRA